MTRLVTFTNLFPSALRPTHGLFVWERMRRVVAALGWDWVVVAPVPHVPWPMRRGSYRTLHREPDREDWHGVTVHRPRYRHVPRLSVRRQARNMHGACGVLLDRLTQGGESVLDAHYAYPDGVAAGLWAKAHPDVPWTVTARGTDVRRIGGDPIRRREMGEVLAGASLALAVSESLRLVFREVLGCPDDHVLCARNGVDLELFTPGDRAAACRQLGLDPARRWVLGVGRLIPAKGFHVVAHAVQGLPADVGLAVVGQGGEAERIRRIGGARVELLGPRPPGEVALALQAAAVMAFPTEHSEGWPNVVTEALASGTPVVGTDNGAIPEMLADPVAGRIIPPADPVACRDALAAVLAAPPEPGAVRRWAERFSWDAPVAALAAGFRALAAGASPDAARRAFRDASLEREAAG